MTAPISAIWNGETITVPGIYARIPISVYHSADICDGPSLSSSQMRTIIHKSEADYWDTSPLNPNRGDIDDDEKRQFVLGRAVHHLMLGEDFFSKLFVIRPAEINGKAYHGSSNDWKKWHVEQRDLGRSVLTQDEGDRVYGMMKAVAKYPLIKQHGMLNGLIERSMFWKDRKTGVWIKVRPDVIPKDSDDATDLKTTLSVKRVDLMTTVDKYAYYQQGALAREAWRQIFGRDLNSFNLVFVQSKRPHCVKTHPLEPEDLDRGEKLNRIAIDKFAACLKSGHWPGPDGDHEDLRYLALSPRARERIDDLIKYGATI
jgi:hypothetical protein